MINMIVATSKNNCIGINNHMPWHIPKDLAYFKEKTLGKPIIMGRKTFESIGRPLSGRENIVLTRDINYKVEGITVIHEIEDLLRFVKDKEVFIIGGGEVYEIFRKYADILYITIVDVEIDGDTYFISYKDDFEIISEKVVRGEPSIRFTKWVRKNK